MFHKLVDFCFRSHNIPDWMHNLGRVFIMFLELICGGHGGNSRAVRWQSAGYDRKHRAECEMFGIFRATWLEQKLPDDVHAALRQVTDDQIATATRVDLERWAKAVGARTAGILVETLREKEFGLINKVRQPGPYLYTPNPPAPLPWRLTATAFDEVDRRIVNLIFPHSTENLVRNGRQVCVCMRVLHRWVCMACV